MRILFLMAMMTTTTGPSPRRQELWLVFSPTAPLNREDLRRGPRPDRLVLALENYFLGTVPDRFLKDVEFLRSWLGDSLDLPVVDIEALKELRTLGVRRLPALLLFDAPRVHIIEGIPSKFPEIESCPR